jgi:hypothetical protein
VFGGSIEKLIASVMKESDVAADCIADFLSKQVLSSESRCIQANSYLENIFVEKGLDIHSKVDISDINRKVLVYFAQGLG